MIKGKTIEALRSIRPLFLLIVLAFPPAAGASQLMPIRRDSLRDVTFSGDCAVRQDSELRDGALELLLSANRGHACVATLELNSPVLIGPSAGLQFTARGTRPHQTLQFEFSRTAEDDVHLLRSPPFEVVDEWRDDALRFSRLHGDSKSDQLASIRIIAVPNPHAAIQPAIAIRGLRFVSLSLRSSRPADEITPRAPAPTPQPLTLAQASPPPSEPSLPPMKPITPKRRISFHLPDYRQGMHSRLNRWGFLMFWASLAITLTWRKKGQAAQALSPLYELNTRTWKSTRDGDGIVHVGGFNRIAMSDLKAIKSSGFNSLWLMGIWEIGPKVRAISKRYGADFAGSPFAISDYRISEELGTEQEFKQLVDRAHESGLSVIVDFVPNHMGLDSDWLNEHPEYFIHRVLDAAEEKLPDSELEVRYAGHFVYRTPSYPEAGTRVPKTIMVSYGKDPYFYPWIDTAQLDYANPGLRRKMIDVLSRWAKIVDGVRCDMAMLVLREQVKIHRHPEMSWENFNRWMPEEFWSEAIRVVKRVNPQFSFMAETYWAMEGYLQHLGFDYTYNKPLYEAICNAFHNGNAEGLMNFVRMLGTDFLKKGVHFLENHDEERAMNALGEERQRAAAALLFTLPGIALIHQGQLEGKRERLPVQRVVPLAQEQENASLAGFYRQLLQTTALPVFREGRLNVLYSNNSSFIAFARILNDTKAMVIINTSNHYQKGIIFVAPGLRLKAGGPYRLDDLFYGLKSKEVRRQPTVRPSYTYPAAQLINQGLYVELQPFDAHIFLLEQPGAYALKERWVGALREVNDQLPLPRIARRVLGPAFMRSSDHSSNLP